METLKMEQSYTENVFLVFRLSLIFILFDVLVIVYAHCLTELQCNFNISKLLILLQVKMTRSSCEEMQN